ncbi:MAG: NAD-dependent epimerase/dehydratase family protein [Deltaproteobacteria bacterium]|nr:NAD-dependent epimerase/dehydratase family protein [Deltaproteobacteria bacterium]
MTRTVCVTGATGGLGLSLVSALRQRGDAVKALVRRTSSTEDLYRLGCDLVEGDITDHGALLRAMDGCDGVFHAAARVGDWGPEDELARVNIQGTVAALEAAREARVGRFVHVSSTAVYGATTVKVLEETLPVCTSGRPYADSKVAAERRVFAFAKETGLAVSVVRPCRLYGPHDRTFLPRLASHLRGGRFVYFVDPSTPVNLVHASHAVDVLLRALEHPLAVGEAFNVSDGAMLPLKALVEALCRCLRVPPPRLQVPTGVARAGAAALEGVWRLARAKSPPVVTVGLVEGLAQGSVVSCEKARRVLGFAPAFGTAEGIAQVMV